MLEAATSCVTMESVRRKQAMLEEDGEVSRSAAELTKKVRAYSKVHEVAVLVPEVAMKREVGLER